MIVEPARPEDAAEVSRLLRDYLTVTEQEKIERGLAAAGPLPQRYQDEIDRPAILLADTWLARADGVILGMVTLKAAAGQIEIKRLWVDPQARGTGVGRALAGTAIEQAGDRPVTLTVWDWRTAPIALYRSLGFTENESWDDRDHLICMTFQSSKK
jgi:ribosomal protein S18 acetylase RimI-like enzyme